MFQQKWMGYLLTAAATMVATCVIFIGFLASGLTYFGAKSPSQKVRVVSTICGTDIINGVEKSLKEFKLFEKDSLKTEMNFIRENVDSDSDVNCVYVSALNQVSSGDIGGLKKSIEKLNKFANDGVFPNNKILLTGGSYDSLLSSAELAHPSSQTQPDGAHGI